MKTVDASFSDLVREAFQPLLTEHGFVVVGADAHEVVLESPRLRSRTRLSPRGELDVSVFPKDTPEWVGWSYSGMVGRASIVRLLELALEQMVSDPRILVGNGAFYEQLASERKAEAEAFTTYAEGKGPRPRRGELP
jgi:hypothetical protein